MSFICEGFCPLLFLQKKGIDKMAIRKTDKGYYVEVYLGVNPITNKKIRKTKTFIKLKDAKDWEREIIQDYKDGATDLNGDMLLANYLEYWYDTYVMANTKYQTQKRYRTIVNCVSEHLGHLQLKGVKTPHVDRLYADLKKEMVTYKDGATKRRYMDGTILKVHRVFRQAMEKAVAWEMIARNPVSYAQPPKDDKRNIATWTMAETTTFLNGIRDTVMFLPCFIAFHAGLRAGEISALRWKDVSFEDNLIYVENGAVEHTGKGMMLDDPKTESSKDSVTMTKALTDTLKRVKREQNINRLANGLSREFEYVCCWEDGRPVRPNYISTKFGELIKEYNLKTITFHGLRHTHASVLFELGESSHAISKRLRHSRVSTTDDIYIHLTDDTKKSTADLFDQAVEKIK